GPGADDPRPGAVVHHLGDRHRRRSGGHHGWSAAEEALTDLAERHARPVPPAFDPALPGTGRVRLLTADR
ncbi:hypothetical protein ACWEWX_54750, partial [Streptomyces asiaticus]